MATLAGQRAQFTWALRQYNLSEDSEKQAFYARRMAKYVATAPANGFTVEEVTQGQLYPAAEVAQYWTRRPLISALNLPKAKLSAKSRKQSMSLMSFVWARDPLSYMRMAIAAHRTA